jgi:phosphoglycerate dehydrogenase-like enzyme
MRSRDVVFTNSAGIHAPPMAETVLGMILHFGRGLDFAVRNQGRGVWSTDPWYAAGAPVRELSRTTVGLLGFGGIGREVARRVASLGARVLASKRTPPRPGDAELQAVAGGGSLAERIELVHGVDGWARLLDESDVLVLCAPETDETRGILDAAALARLKDGAVVINVGRGRLVVLEDLVAELRHGRLRGAGLDVFPREPLTEEHPLWTLPNVLLTPHVSAVTHAFWEREGDLILHNLRCFLENADPWSPETRWRNVVDKEAGY